MALIGLTGVGKTSMFNLMTNSKNALGNKIMSQTEECSIGETENNASVYIDTVSLKDSRGDREGRYKVIDFLLSFKDGMDVIFFAVKHGVFGNDDRDLFDETYQRLLTQDAYRNSCLVITSYDRFDPQTNYKYVKNTEKQQQLIAELRKNRHYAYVLDRSEDRVICVNIPSEELIGGEQWDAKLKARNKRKRESSKLRIESFLDSFTPSHYDCENLQQFSQIQKHNDSLQEEKQTLKEQNELLEHQLTREMGQCCAAVQERVKLESLIETAVDRSQWHNVMSFIPILNWYTSYKDVISRSKVKTEMKASKK